MNCLHWWAETNKKKKKNTKQFISYNIEYNIFYKRIVFSLKIHIIYTYYVYNKTVLYFPAMC